MNPAQMTFGILAGGKSRRMGRDKKDLLWQGKTFLGHLIQKGEAAGFGEILISCNQPIETPFPVLGDRLPDRGPLAGLEQLLNASSYEWTLVVSVDTPQLPTALFWQLSDAVQGGCPMLLKTVDGPQPFPGCYPKRIAKEIAPLLKEGGAPVRALLARTGSRTMSYTGEKLLVQSINTPEEYRALINFGNVVKE